MRILLVEHEERIASFIARGLKEARYVVDVANDGEKGFYMAEMNESDLITQSADRVKNLAEGVARESAGNGERRTRRRIVPLNRQRLATCFRTTSLAAGVISSQ